MLEVLAKDIAMVIISNIVFHTLKILLYSIDTYN